MNRHNTRAVDKEVESLEPQLSGDIVRYLARDHYRKKKSHLNIDLMLIIDERSLDYNMNLGSGK